MELLLIGSLTACAFLVIVEIEQFVVVFTIGQNTTGGERLPSIGHIDAERTLADDGHIVGIQLCPDNGVLITVGSHDDKLVVSSPCMGVLTFVICVLFERLSLDNLHLVVLELQFHEAIFRVGHLIIVLATDNGLHRVVGIYLCTDILEVNRCTCIQSVTTLHDGGHVTTHTALLAYGNCQVKVMGT